MWYGSLIGVIVCVCNNSCSRCNRFKEQQAAKVQVDKARQGMMEEYTKAAKESEARKRERFEHYFSRYSNHLNSLEVRTFYVTSYINYTNDCSTTPSVCTCIIIIDRFRLSCPHECV